MAGNRGRHARQPANEPTPPAPTPKPADRTSRRPKPPSLRAADPAGSGRLAPQPAEEGDPPNPLAQAAEQLL